MKLYASIFLTISDQITKSFGLCSTNSTLHFGALQNSLAPTLVIGGSKYGKGNRIKFAHYTFVCASRGVVTKSPFPFVNESTFSPFIVLLTGAGDGNSVTQNAFNPLGHNQRGVLNYLSTTSHHLSKTFAD